MTDGAIPARERIVILDGRRVRLLEANPLARPTFVIEAALGFHAVHYAWLLKFLGADARVIAYDRAGLGLSEPACEPADGEGRARQLHRLVEHLDLNPPVYFIGHSIGGLYLHIFARTHPEWVAGLILLDATHPTVHTAIRTRLPFAEKVAELSASFARGLGQRALPWTPQPGRVDPWRTLPDWGRHQSSEISRRVEQIRTTAAERRSHARTAARAAALGALRGVPLLVITAGRRSARELRYAVDPDAFMPAWMAAQRELAAQSTSARHEILAEAGHCGLVTDPAHARAACALIRRFVADPA